MEEKVYNKYKDKNNNHKFYEKLRFKEKYFMEYGIWNNKQNLLTTEHILCYYEYNN